jgi:hypothetical protein
VSAFVSSSRCTSCGTNIIWATTAATGKVMPVDVEPHPDGNVLLTERVGRSPLAEVVAPGQDSLIAGEPLRRSHFSTCPQADQHRRAR